MTGRMRAHKDTGVKIREKELENTTYFDFEYNVVIAEVES
jgi:hypothetical protein